MKSRITLSIGLLLAVILIVVASCRRENGEQWIVYVSDSQTWIVSPDGTRIQLALDLEMSTRGIRWSPDGTRMAFTAGQDPSQAGLWIANADGSDPHEISGELNSATWLSDDILIASLLTEKTEGVFDVANYTFDLRDDVMNLYSQGFEDVVPIKLRERWLAWNGVSGLVLHDLGGNAWSLSPDLLPTSAHAFDASPSGDMIIVCQHSTSGDVLSGVYAATLEPDGIGEPRLVYPVEEGMCTCARWSPNGRYVAFLDNQHVLYLLDAASFSLLRSFDIGPLTESSFFWSPDSRFVAVSRHYGEPGSGPKEIARVDIETGEIVRVTNNESVEYLTDWVVLPSR
jgi:Tol biopolymer transport system component